MKVLGLCLPYIKRHFQKHQWSVFFFMAQITHIVLFWGMSLLERSKITIWERHLFKKKIIYESFGFVSALHNKVFSGARVKCVFLYGSNNSYCIVFGNAAWKNQRSQFESRSFWKKNYLRKFWICVCLT